MPAVFIGALCVMLLLAVFPGAVRLHAAANPDPTTVTYCAPHGRPLKMDFYRPRSARIVPVVVQVHPGGWRAFNRKTGVTPGLVSAFLKQRMAFATIDYRLRDAPQAIEDVACAVRYLRASAKKLRIDGRHVGAMGQSAGGQLVSLLGTSDRAAGFDVGQYPKQSSRVQAVVDEWGPVIFDRTLLKTLPYIPKVFGTGRLNALKKYSPLTYLSADDPPFLLIQGAQDTTVPASQSRVFAAALRSHGIPERLIVVQHAKHELVAVGGRPRPTVAQVQTQIVRFFAQRLHA